jgi:hypothetical protein
MIRNKKGGYKNMEMENILDYLKENLSIKLVRKPNAFMYTTDITVSLILEGEVIASDFVTILESEDK